MADNGRPFPRCKTRVYDSGMKTPLIVFWPEGIKSKGLISSSLISSIDLAPSILELAGVNIPEDFQGISFVDVLKNPSVEIRTAVFSEHNWHDYEAHERMIRTKDFLYVLNSRPWLTNCGPADSKSSPTQHALNKLTDEGSLTSAQTDVFVVPRPAEELYDVKNDPHQLINVASLPLYQTELNELRNLLNNWRSNTGDTTPKDLTPDWYDRETGKDLKTEKRRGTMPGIMSVN
jgi:arylsulfatase A-like enzyme